MGPSGPEGLADVAQVSWIDFKETYFKEWVVMHGSICVYNIYILI